MRNCPNPWQSPYASTRFGVSFAIARGDDTTDILANEVRYHLTHGKAECDAGCFSRTEWEEGLTGGRARFGTWEDDFPAKAGCQVHRRACLLGKFQDPGAFSCSILGTVKAAGLAP